jgi:hypothetical protein
LTKTCSHRLIATPTTNPPEVHYGQDVLEGDLQYVHYDLVYMYEPSPKIQEVTEFHIKLNIKLNWNAQKRILSHIALFRPMKLLLSYLNNFYRFAHL